MAKAAPGLSVKSAQTATNAATATNAVNAASATNAANLGGQPASTYLTTARTIDLGSASATSGFTKTLTGVPAGTYLVDLSLSAVTSADTGLFCFLTQDGAPRDLLDTYSSRYIPTVHTVSASHVVTILPTGALTLGCYPSTGTLTYPATSGYAPPQLTLMRIDSVTALGAVTAPPAGGARSAHQAGVPTTER
ncbi:hypothetical protein G5V58_18600 [Nocardioides anomalus]|uniref:Uncharacterized protein n=1 Tax=Nocardioides anomalus TaxID=2712223 RepID=A0A6G6WH97_9ACTN|nr:hypothetical protein [Nocardioides anomalus]QIG44523.1 hypothetical protein G5V58_18600 [Nocardioides anomalus]